MVELWVSTRVEKSRVYRASYAWLIFVYQSLSFDDAALSNKGGGVAEKK